MCFRDIHTTLTPETNEKTRNINIAISSNYYCVRWFSRVRRGPETFQTYTAQPDTQDKDRRRKHHITYPIKKGKEWCGVFAKILMLFNQKIYIYIYIYIYPGALIFVRYSTQFLLVSEELMATNKQKKKEKRKHVQTLYGYVYCVFYMFYSQGTICGRK